jgi:hypothetical protein
MPVAAARGLLGRAINFGCRCCDAGIIRSLPRFGLATRDFSRRGSGSCWTHCDDRLTTEVSQVTDSFATESLIHQAASD